MSRRARAIALTFAWIAALGCAAAGRAGPISADTNPPNTPPAPPVTPAPLAVPAPAPAPAPPGGAPTAPGSRGTGGGQPQPPGTVPPARRQAPATLKPPAHIVPPPPKKEPRPAGLPSDAELERSHAVIGRIIIDNQNIFDLSDPKEQNWIFRLANRLHARTRPQTVLQQLLFHPGDRYSRRLLDESARILRANIYFYDASVRPVAYADGKVDVLVSTKDVWTLNPGLNFGRSGGTNTTGGQLEEENFLGTGTDLLYEHSVNVDRTVNLFQVSNSNIAGSWIGAGLSYSDNSDGRTGEVSVSRPFYSFETRNAWGTDLQTGTRNDFTYDLGNIVNEYREQYHLVRAWAGFSPGLENGWVQRWSFGATLDMHQFSPEPSGGTVLLPEDRKLIYPYVQLDLLEDKYITLIDHNQIKRTEDFYLGTQFHALLGVAARAWGSDRNSLIVSGSAGKGFNVENQTTLLLSTSWSGRLDDGALRNAAIDVNGRYYVNQSERALFFTTFDLIQTHKLDLDNQLLLGGDSGLRGYPLRYQSGTGRVLLTAEERYFTDWYPFRLWRVGGAVFADAGRTWGSAPLSTPSLGLLEDFGFGLRLGNARSGLGAVTHVDIAFPIEHSHGIKTVQFLVSTEQSF